MLKSKSDAMNMKRFFLFALVASVLAACSTDTTQDLTPEIPTVPTQLYASFDGQDARVELQGRTMVWTAGDLVSVFYLSNGNDKWAFQGSTGDERGSLMKVAAGEATSATSRVVAVYPYSDTYSIDPATLVVRASLSAEQSYLKDSFGVGSSILVSSGETDHLVFKNVCGWLKLQFAGADAKRVEKITLQGNDGEQVAGDIYINSSDGSCVTASASDAASADDVILTSVTLDCGSGVELNGESPTSFYIALPPQTFAKGLTATAVCADGTQMTKTTPKQVVVKRGHIVPMEEVKYAATNVIYYTSTDGTVVEPESTDVFGANILSNIYDNGVGVITFDGEVSSIGDSAFNSCYALQSITIPDSVTSIGAYAFSSCANLESVTLGRDIKSIGSRAFWYCSKLKEFNCVKASKDKRTIIIDGRVSAFAPAGITEYTIPDGVSVIGDAVFSECRNLTNITLNRGITIIEQSAFSLCTNLTSIEIPDSVVSIESSAFANCNSMKNITIGSGLKSIGKNAFYISGVKNVYISDLDAWCQISFADNDANPIKKNTNIYIDGVLTTNVVLPRSVSAYAFYGTNIESIASENGVESIGEYAFYGCANLKHIDISKGVTAVKDYAFFGCSVLSSVLFSEVLSSIGMHAFESCRTITSITLPSSIASIGRDAFYVCSALKEVCCLATTPPQCVEYYGRWSAFNNNATDRKIYVPASVDDSVIDAYKNASGWSAYADAIVEKEFGDSNKKTVLRYTSTDGNVVTPNKADAFNVGIVSNTYDNDEGTIVFDGTLTTIGASAFYDCTTLSSITIPDSVTEIGAYAFQWCNWLKTVAMGSGVKSIGRGAFWNCTFLQNIELPAGIELIDIQAFYLCKLLKSINIPDSITEIKASTFENCYALKSVNIGQNVEIIGQNAFNHCDALTSVVIPNKVTVIGLYAFSSCTSLQTVTIGTSVTRIDDYAFDTCYSLTSVAISDSVQEIGSYAFYDCASLVSVTIPKNVTKIKNHTFDKCYALTSVYCEPTTPPTCGSEVFNNNASGRKIYVPSASVNDYKVAVGWSTYADAIEPYEFGN